MSGTKVANTYPHTKWQGASDIHRSFYRQFGANVSSENVKDLMKLLLHAGFPSHVFDLVKSQLPGTEEWILSPEEFVALTVVDLYRHMNGQGSSETNKMIKNPSTGNIFHRIGFKDDIVIGIRYWVSDYGAGSQIGFRVRVTTDSGDPIKVRKNARQSVEAQVEMVGEIIDSLGIGEPTVAEASAAKVSLGMLAEED